MLEHEETTHYSIVDRWGNAVAVTTTLNGSYGSKVVVAGAGFLLNNEMDDFSVKPGVPNMYGLTGGMANAIEPGKRMLSSMTPTILEREGGLFLVLGTPGGSTIITTVAQIIVDVLDFNMSIEDAVAAPRFHHQWIPDRITYEMGAFGRELIDDMSHRGHDLAVRKTSIGNAQVIRTDGSLLCGASDPRGYGTAEGIDAPIGSGR
jgi:gamma-glutamyltranspeptidase/glutathione hydrolase